MPTPMSDLATFASVMTIFAKALSPSQPAICARIVPAISVTNKPCAMPENAVMKYLFGKVLK